MGLDPKKTHRARAEPIAGLTHTIESWPRAHRSGDENDRRSNLPTAPKTMPRTLPSSRIMRSRAQYGQPTMLAGPFRASMGTRARPAVAAAPVGRHRWHVCHVQVARVFPDVATLCGGDVPVNSAMSLAWPAGFGADEVPQSTSATRKSVWTHVARTVMAVVAISIRRASGCTAYGDTCDCRTQVARPGSSSKWRRTATRELCVTKLCEGARARLLDGFIGVPSPDATERRTRHPRVSHARRSMSRLPRGCHMPFAMIR